MQGTYQMVGDDGERFDAPIAPFRLAMPGIVATALPYEMTTWAIGDIQGCHDELCALVAQLGFRADRDQLWSTGDLVNRGPDSLETLRYVRSALGDNAITRARQPRPAPAGRGVRKEAPSSNLRTLSRTCSTLATAMHCWNKLLSRPLAHHDVARKDVSRARRARAAVDRRQRGVTGARSGNRALKKIRAPVR